MSNKDELLAEANAKGVEVPEGATKAEVQALLDENEGTPDNQDLSNAASDQDNEETTPAEQAEEDVEKSGVQGTDIEGSTVNDSDDPSEPDAVSEGANDEDQTVAVQADGIDGVDRDHTPATSNSEEAAAARAGVSDELLDNPKQNREPKNEFEKENQLATEKERQAAQEVSDMTTKERVESSQTPNEIATAIAEGFKRSKDDSFELEAEPGINPRFTLVKNKQTGEVMIRENETGTLSKIQLLSLEEKEADVQSTQVEEL